jgi:hypothetical protein
MKGDRRTNIRAAAVPLFRPLRHNDPMPKFLMSDDCKRQLGRRWHQS